MGVRTCALPISEAPARAPSPIPAAPPASAGAVRDPMTVYLDYNATAPIRPQARAAMTAALAEPGNASSVHGPGRRARRLIETARAQVAALADADPTWVIFTSGDRKSTRLNSSH